MIKKFLKRSFLVNIKNNYYIKKAYKSDYELFKKNWIYSKTNNIKRGYNIILEVHSLEKGMTSEKPRKFGVSKVNNIMKLIDDYELSNNSNIDFAYILGINALKSYCQFYEKLNWENANEYIEIKKYLEKKKEIREIKVGSYSLKKSDFINDALIDYDRFLSSRHSVRNFMDKKITDDDAKKAVSMAIKSPSACNRQMCKIYFINDEIKREKTIKYGHGLTNFNLNNTNIFIITFDISSYCSIGDRHQGWFNSGLFAMNFVNALHSIGIGSCFIQFGNEINEELELKRLLNIPENEKISIMIAAGYYNDKSIIPYSTRKGIDEIYRKI